MATSLRFCSSCKAIWVPDEVNVCAQCNTPGVVDDVTVAYCQPCDTAWNPRVTLNCWMCGHGGVYRKEVRAWEQEPGTAIVLHIDLFPATTSPV